MRTWAGEGSGEWRRRRWAPGSGEEGVGGMKTPSVFGRGGLDELTAVDFSPPLAWLLVSPPRTPSSLAFSERARGWAVDLWLVVAWAHYGFVSSSFLEPLRVCLAQRHKSFLKFYIFFRFIKNICLFFIFKNVTQPPVLPAEGCYRRMNRR